MGRRFASPFSLVALFILLTSLIEAQFPKINVVDLNGKPLLFPQEEPQIVFLSSSTKVRSDLRKWNQTLRLHRSHISNPSIRGIAIMPPWLAGGITQPLALLYLKTLLPQQFHDSVYVYFATEEEASSLFNLPKGTEEDLHLFFLSNRGNILVYTYGSPTEQKLEIIKTFSQSPSSTGAKVQRN